MPKVLISDKMSPLAEQVFKQKNIIADVKTGLSSQELQQIIGEYDGLAIRSATNVTNDVVAKANNLKVIGRAGIGVDNVDINAATDKGIIVMNTPFGNSITTAEHAIAMMFAVARKIPQASHSTHLGKWEKSKFMGVELTGKTLGIIGCGNIGAIVAKKSLGLQMKVLSYDPFLTEEKANALNIQKVTLDKLLELSDFITLHVPLNDATRNILNHDTLSKAKKGVYIINCARGGLVSEQALKDGLDSGHIAGAALDVFEVEPAKENILFGHEKVVMTPHLGASTKEAQENVAVQVAEQIANFLNDNVIENSLNIPSVSPEDAKLLKPYILLGEQMGDFIGQIMENPIKEINITYHGAVTKLNTKPITANIIKNILARVIEGVNIVNSKKIAEKRGIIIKDIISNEISNYNTYININIVTEKRTRSISGTLFANEPRIIKINDVRLEASMSTNMLYISNQDKPGLIGEVGKLLGSKNINIANFHLGRTPNGSEDAIALIAIDSELNEETLNIIREMPSVIQAKTLRF